MFKFRLLALLALCVSLIGSSALAQTLMAETASCTVWVREHTVYQGHKGISEAEASRLHVGTELLMPDGSRRSLEPKGSSIWRQCHDYVKGGRPNVRTPTSAEVSPPQPTERSTKHVSSMETYYAEQAADEKKTEASEAAKAAKEGASLTETVAKAAEAAEHKGDAKAKAVEARSAADMVATAAKQAADAAKTATRITTYVDTPKTRAAAASAQASANDAATSAKMAEAAAARAELAPHRFVIQWPMTVLAGIASLFGLLWTVVLVGFLFFSEAFNNVFEESLEQAERDELTFFAIAILLIIIAPIGLVWWLPFGREFKEVHYGYLVDAEDFSTNAGYQAWISYDGQHRARLQEQTSVEAANEQDTDELSSVYEAEHPMTLNRTVAG